MLSQLLLASKAAMLVHTIGVSAHVILFLQAMVSELLLLQEARNLLRLAIWVYANVVAFKEMAIDVFTSCKTELLCHTFVVWAHVVVLAVLVYRVHPSSGNTCNLATQSGSLHTNCSVLKCSHIAFSPMKSLLHPCENRLLHQTRTVSSSWLCPRVSSVLCFLGGRSMALFGVKQWFTSWIILLVATRLAIYLGQTSKTRPSFPLSSYERLEERRR